MVIRNNRPDGLTYFFIIFVDLNNVLAMIFLKIGYLLAPIFWLLATVQC